MPAASDASSDSSGSEDSDLDRPSFGADVPLGRTVAAVARRLGVAPATLRTWDRRYGLGPSEHTAGAHRRYTATDVERLALMRRLTLDGITPADAARHVLHSGSDGASVTSIDRAEGKARPVVVDRSGEVRAQTRAQSNGRRDDRARETSTEQPAASRNHGGGTVLSLPGSEPAVRGLARAAMALDDRSCIAAIKEHLAAHGVRATWTELITPVLIAIGERWEATGVGVDVEHLLSESVLVALRSVPAPQEPLNAAPVLLAAAEDDQHALALHVLRAALAEKRISARVLGARVPRDALAAAVRRTGPPVVFVWSQMSPTGDPDQLAAIPHLRPTPAIVVGGPGWEGVELPSSVHRVDSLADAVETMHQLAHP